MTPTVSASLWPTVGDLLLFSLARAHQPPIKQPTRQTIRGARRRCCASRCCCVSRSSGANHPPGPYCASRSSANHPPNHLLAQHPTQDTTQCCVSRSQRTWACMANGSGPSPSSARMPRRYVTLRHVALRHITSSLVCTAPHFSMCATHARS
jgi:hypothetical protein